MAEVSLTETTGAGREWITLEKHLLCSCYRPGAVSQKEVLSTSLLVSIRHDLSTVSYFLFPDWQSPTSAFFPKQQGVVFRQMTQDNWVDSITWPKASAIRGCQLPAERLWGPRIAYVLPPAGMNTLCKRWGHRNLEWFYLHMLLGWISILGHSFPHDALPSPSRSNVFQSSAAGEVAPPPGLGQHSDRRHSTWWQLLQGARSHSSQLSAHSPVQDQHGKRRHVPSRHFSSLQHFGFKPPQRWVWGNTKSSDKGWTAASGLWLPWVTNSNERGKKPCIGRPRS